jgi:hypothetical protein
LAAKLASEKLAAQSLASSSSSSPGSWYLQGRHSEYVDIQPEVTTEILHCIHNELSHESKVSLIRSVEAHTKAIQEKVLYASDSDLRQLCFDMGLGGSLSDIPQGKERKYYVEWILKYGRSK